MATPETPTWSQGPPAAARNRLLQRYLPFWLARQFGGTARSVVYADGFAGPGRYSGGEPGAPVIAYREARRAADAWPGKQVDVLLVEERGDRLELLRGELAECGDPDPAVPTTYRRGGGTRALAQALDAAAKPAGPVFALLDSPEGRLVPFDILRRIAENKASEVMLTFTPGNLSRIGTGELQPQTVTEIFGGAHWDGVFRQLGSAKYTYLVTQYRASLSLAGFEHVLSVEMVDRHGGDVVHLVFATNTQAGLKTMKDALWTLEDVPGVQYRDPRDPIQELIEIRGDPPEQPLRRQLLMVLRDHPDGMSVKQLREFTLARTVYRALDADRSIQVLIEEGLAENTAPGRLTQRAIVRLTAPPADPHAWPHPPAPKNAQP
jgi:three-Cys-motif partner protein